jgi:hypothetical protein
MLPRNGFCLHPLVCHAIPFIDDIRRCFAFRASLPLEDTKHARTVIFLSIKSTSSAYSMGLYAFKQQPPQAYDELHIQTKAKSASMEGESHHAREQ